MGDGFYRSKDPTNSIKVKDNKEKANNKIHICTDNNRHKKGYKQNKHKSPSLPYNMG